MHIGKIEIKRRVWIGLAFAVVVTGVWWARVRVPPPVALAAKPVRSPVVRLAGAGHGEGDQVLREQADLLDPNPLFFPTEWNFGQRPLKENMLRQPGQVFESFPPHYTFVDPNLKTYGGEAVVGPGRLAEVVVQNDEAPFAGMGQIDVQRPVLAERSLFLEVEELINGKNIIAQSLTGLSLPRLDFGPAEFLVVVSSAGVVGDPILMAGSGWAEVDVFLRSYLVKSFHLGERLRPGRYRVSVGP